MNIQSPFGFQETSHTADWELNVWAPDLVTLLEQAARGMYHLSGVELVSAPRLARRISLPFHDPEMLLIDFLTELLFLVETEELAFDEFKLEFEGNQFIAKLTGAELESILKEIKAVTYHNLEIQKTDRGLEVSIVFDV
jgi:SHS2 domain-containing protein